MKVYEDSSKTELVTEIPENRILSLLDWEHAEFGKEVFLLSVPIRPDGSNGMFDILVAVSAEFGTDFDNICSDQMELCISKDNMKTALYIANGDDDGIWGSVELSKDEFLAIMDETYKHWREMVEHEYIVS
ncbi:hypothetical protein [Enterocloster citroniae]|uniref:Uncharacterized protein n=1 Tax=[Clostridium] citroniae WAL-17108 TaxID=742733 RepID=G5HQJ5_9FIRM|nr:hypothetical protein [Enterocloster citroniae]EHE96321.1 hypothetical protein HMPREF9469_04857 [ [[Clostridium] citroniae WAL-17108]MCC3387113.1 hypothetical protein [Enterocloster citroniae]